MDWKLNKKEIGSVTDMMRRLRFLIACGVCVPVCVKYQAQIQLDELDY